MQYVWLPVLAFAIWLTGPGRVAAQGVQLGGQDLALWVASPTAIFFAGIVAGIVEAAKRNGLPNNWSPVLAIVLGFLGSLLYVMFYGGGIGWRPEVGDILIRGLTIGLMAGGVWALTRTATRVAGGEENMEGRPQVDRRAPR